jgi:glutamate--cysteine ligase regulatory subunit
LNDPEIQKNDKGTQQLFQRKCDDLLEKIKEHERSSIKIGAKVFLNSYSENCLTDAIDKLFDTLQVDFLDNLILAYHPRSENLANGTAEHHQNEEVKEGIIEWGIGSPNALKNLKTLWKTLEGYVQQNKICQLGIADLDVETLQDLYESSVVHPTITQINLSACCVVPPALKDFCTQKEIQLLTHSDPQGECLAIIYIFVLCR